MEKDPSPLDTLRQLKEWLDAGTITPAEFETLKRKLVFDQNETASSARTSTTAGPVEDPLLPPISTPFTPPSPEPNSTAVPPFSPPAPTPPASFEAPRSYEPSTGPLTSPADYPSEEPTEEEEIAPPAPARNPLALVLTIGGVVLLLGLVLYLALGSRESERLTSTSRTEADSVAVQPEVGPQAQQIDLPPATAPETVRVAPVVPPTAAADSTAAAATTTPPATAPVTPSAPVADEATVRNRVLNALNSYYDDLKEAPFDASQHFAPTVERFYTMQNTTPAAINDDLTKTHFPEFLEADTQVDPASLQIGPPANDGTRVITYLEKGKAFRQSRQQHQQTTAQVRVRLDPDYKIVYLRQERLLENTFTD